MQSDDVFHTKHEISGEIYYAALLHEHPELLNDCCELINTEWKRSHVARLRSISSSSSNFPTSVLLLKESKKPEIIGHCKLSKISHSTPVIFAETVVIHPKYRGKGLGKLLMQKAENYVKSKGIHCICLTTTGQKLFYEKLGYSYCEPISIYGGNLDNVFADTGKTVLLPQEKTMTVEKYIEKSELLQISISDTIPQTIPPPLPLLPIPPPPPPPQNSLKLNIINVTNKKTFMRKKI